MYFLFKKTNSKDQVNFSNQIKTTLCLAVNEWIYADTHWSTVVHSAADLITIASARNLKVKEAFTKDQIYWTVQKSKIILFSDGSMENIKGFFHVRRP